ncbi:unnamed protein product [Rhizoctonia solani]|uniref:CHAT domain-containing protein n=1 Tax=Rhizoctonia solani TaxID=456999 RepID=A0A8H3BQX1_9AGAM|nr:unnamed protein product [Rhizoctonia solani]
MQHELPKTEKSIDPNTRALSLIPGGHQNQPILLPRLANSHNKLFDLQEKKFDLLNKSFDLLGELGGLSKSIQNMEIQVIITPDDDPGFLHLLDELVVSLQQRFERVGDANDAEYAIHYGDMAISLTPDGHPDMSRRLISMALSLTNQFECLGGLNDLDEAIECEYRALSLTPNGHPDLPALLSHLGVSHSYRFERLGELGDLEKSIEHKSHAVEITPDGHHKLSSRLVSLGVSHARRFLYLGELCSLEDAIKCGTRGVRIALNNRDNPQLSILLNKLGTFYSYRFERLRELDDLEKAMEFQSRAVALCPKGHPDLADQLNNLATSHDYRFQHLGELDDLKKSIDYKSRAVFLTPDGDPGLPSRHCNLAESYMDLFQRTDDPSHQQHTLSFFRLGAESLTGAPRVTFKNAIQWANHASKHSFLIPLEAYQIAIDLLPQFIWLGATTHQRYEDLLLAESLAVNAASVAIFHSDYSLAFEWLEHARCVVWNQSLVLRSPLDELRSAHPELADRLQQVTNQLHSMSSESRESRMISSGSLTVEEVAQEHHKLAEQYQKLLSEVHSLPSFKEFLRPMKASGLVRAARHGPIVIINCNGDRCDALAVLPQGDIKHIPLTRYTGKKAQQTRCEMEQSLQKKRTRDGGVERRPVFLAKKVDFKSVLGTLWNDVVKPILDYLGYTKSAPTGNMPHITWCPTGALSFLPLHAAGDYEKPQSRVFDYVISSYTPTLTSLLASSPTSLSPNTRVLAIGQADTPEHIPLPGTNRELKYVEAHTQGKVQYSQLTGDKATATVVLDAMEQHDWVHLACHAHQNVQDPTKSGFFLHDDILDLASINRRSFKNKGLAFLSACQTATGDEKLPDEAIHLASGMLMAGYTSVIATMWSVVDDDAPFVADIVYGQLIKGGKLGSGEAGRALHNAVAALREEVGEKEFGRWVPFIHIGS